MISKRAVRAAVLMTATPMPELILQPHLPKLNITSLLNNATQYAQVQVPSCLHLNTTVRLLHLSDHLKRTPIRQEVQIHIRPIQHEADTSIL